MKPSLWFGVIAAVLFLFLSNLSHLRWKAQSCHLLFACGTGIERSGSHMKVSFVHFQIHLGEVLHTQGLFLL